MPDRGYAGRHTATGVQPCPARPWSLVHGGDTGMGTLLLAWWLLLRPESDSAERPAASPPSLRCCPFADFTAAGDGDYLPLACRKKSSTA